MSLWLIIFFVMIGLVFKLKIKRKKKIVKIFVIVSIWMNKFVKNKGEKKRKMYKKLIKMNFLNYMVI